MLRLVVNRWQRHRFASRVHDAGPEILHRSAMVLAPHQDDETLGCGGTVALKRQQGADVTIVFMMDGSRSHVPLISAEELSSIRHSEALAAVRRLGVPDDRVLTFDFPEGHLSQHVDEATDRLFDALVSTAPEELFVPVGAEPNKDHAHTNVVARRALKRWGEPVVVYEYPVWCWYHWPSVPLPLTRRVLGPSRFRYEMPRIVRNTRLMSFGAAIHRDFPVRVPIADVLPVKRAALEEHRSQMTRLRSTPKWATLSDVGGGAWLECFFTTEERFRSHVANAPGATDDGEAPEGTG